MAPSRTSRTVSTQAGWGRDMKASPTLTPRRAPAAAARSGRREAMATTSQRSARRMAGITLVIPILAVLRIPQRRFFIAVASSCPPPRRPNGRLAVELGHLGLGGGARELADDDHGQHLVLAHLAPGDRADGARLQHHADPVGPAEDR